MTHVTQIASSEDQDCGISTYTSSLEEGFVDVEVDRAGIKSFSLDFPDYIMKTIAALRSESDVVHLQHEYGVFGPATICSWPVLLVLLLAKPLVDKPIVVTMHSIWTSETPDSPLRRLKAIYIRVNNLFIFALADHIIFLSENTKEQARGSYKLPPHTVLAHGVQIGGVDITKQEARDMLGWDADADVVVEPGYIRRGKGYEHFVEVAGDHPDKKFVVAGGVRNEKYRDYYNEVRSRAPGNVEFTGILPDERFNAVFAAADLCYLPYELATQSGIVNWAASYGLPVFGSMIPYFRGMSEKTDGIAVYSNDEAADAIATYFEDGGKRERMEKLMYDFAQRNSMSKIAQAHEKIYAKLT